MFQRATCPPIYGKINNLFASSKRSSCRLLVAVTLSFCYVFSIKDTGSKQSSLLLPQIYRLLLKEKFKAIKTNLIKKKKLVISSQTRHQIYISVISDIIYTYPTVLSDTLLVHISGFVHPTRTKIPPLDSADQALYIAPIFVNLQYKANGL